MNSTLITVQLTGLSCQNCVRHITEELTPLPQVESVNIDLVSGGTSTLIIKADSSLSNAEIMQAIDEAGTYPVLEITRSH